MLWEVKERSERKETDTREGKKMSKGNGRENGIFERQMVDRR